MVLVLPNLIDASTVVELAALCARVLRNQSEIVCPRGCALTCHRRSRPVVEMFAPTGRAIRETQIALADRPAP